MGVAPHQHYLALRLNAARRKVIETRAEFADIAALTGFNSSSAFSRSYRAHYHESPTETRRRLRAGAKGLAASRGTTVSAASPRARRAARRGSAIAAGRIERQRRRRGDVGDGMLRRCNGEMAVVEHEVDDDGDRIDLDESQAERSAGVSVASRKRSVIWRRPLRGLGTAMG